MIDLHSRFGPRLQNKRILRPRQAQQVPHNISGRDTEIRIRIARMYTFTQMPRRLVEQEDEADGFVPEFREGLGRIAEEGDEVFGFDVLESQFGEGKDGFFDDSGGPFSCCIIGEEDASYFRAVKF